MELPGAPAFAAPEVPPSGMVVAIGNMGLSRSTVAVMNWPGWFESRDHVLLQSIPPASIVMLVSIYDLCKQCPSAAY